MNSKYVLVLVLIFCSSCGNIAFNPPSRSVFNVSGCEFSLHVDPAFHATIEMNDPLSQDNPGLYAEVGPFNGYVVANRNECLDEVWFERSRQNLKPIIQTEIVDENGRAIAELDFLSDEATFHAYVDGAGARGFTFARKAIEVSDVAEGLYSFAGWAGFEGPDADVSIPLTFPENARTRVSQCRIGLSGVFDLSASPGVFSMNNGRTSISVRFESMRLVVLAANPTQACLDFVDTSMEQINYEISVSGYYHVSNNQATEIYRTTNLGQATNVDLPNLFVGNYTGLIIAAFVRLPDAVLPYLPPSVRFAERIKVLRNDQNGPPPIPIPTPQPPPVTPPITPPPCQPAGPSFQRRNPHGSGRGGASPGGRQPCPPAPRPRRSNLTP